MRKIILLKFFPKNPVFTTNQFDRLSNIFDSAGQVTFGIGVISPLFSGFDKIDFSVVALGITIVSLCWTVSVWLAKKKDETL